MDVARWRLAIAVDAADWLMAPRLAGASILDRIKAFAIGSLSHVACAHIKGPDCFTEGETTDINSRDQSKIITAVL
jgi:hypothetical protein